jgi:hypothetical protein
MVISGMVHVPGGRKVVTSGVVFVPGWASDTKHGWESSSDQ